MHMTYKKYWLSIMLLGFVSTTMADTIRGEGYECDWEDDQQSNSQQFFLESFNFTQLGLGIGIGVLSMLTWNYYTNIQNNKDIEPIIPNPDTNSRTKQDRTSELSFNQRVEVLSKSLHAMEKINLNIPLIACLTQGYTRIKLDKFLKILKKSVTHYNINFIIEKDTDTNLETISPISMNHVELALEEMISGCTTAKELDTKKRIKTAIHEAGHAVAVACDEKFILRSVFIISRTSSNGRNIHCLSDENEAWAINDYKDRIVISLCGGIAEQVFNFDKSWYVDRYPVGQEQNFNECCKLAKHKIISKGLADLLTMPGEVSDMMDARSTARYIAKRYLQLQSSLQDKDDKCGQIEDQVCKILEECYQKALKLLQSHKLIIEKMAQLLMQHEIISGDAVYDLFNKQRPLYRFER